jgi:hypothetical protein
MLYGAAYQNRFAGPRIDSPQLHRLLVVRAPVAAEVRKSLTFRVFSSVRELHGQEDYLFRKILD